MVEKKASNAYGTVNEDLRNERQKCTFDTVELTHLLDGGPEKTKMRKNLGKCYIYLFK